MAPIYTVNFLCTLQHIGKSYYTTSKFCRFGWKVSGELQCFSNGVSEFPNQNEFPRGSETLKDVW